MIEVRSEKWYYRIYMAKKYDHKAIESKWQKFWDKKKIWDVKEDKSSPKFYVLDMFPYPSAEGLHVGHPEGYTASDIVSRYMRMKGFNVLHPMGFDSFGLPAENYAIKTGTHPIVTTKKNIDIMRQQIKSLGFSYDWSREVQTTDPDYYKWTQWIFLQMFNNGLAYEATVPINWCPSCKTGLANEEVVNGKCERCGAKVTKKNIRQWLLRITKYAGRLLKGLDKLDWPEPIKLLQRNWIGRSEGALVKFPISNFQFPNKSQLSNSNSQNTDQYIEVFTTRPDTLFGATYMVLAPEHPLVADCLLHVANRSEVEAYIKKAKSKSDLERTDLAKEKTGVELKGITAVNPVNNEKIPIWMADYVLISYGTGAVMAVSAHDERDFEFAEKYNLPSREVVKGGMYRQPANASAPRRKEAGRGFSWTGPGIMVNSGKYNGQDNKTGAKNIVKDLEKKGAGKKAVNYKLRDWVFSRQRYWGEPIPLVHCDKCGVVPVPEKDLPVKLPEVENYKPTGTGESPLEAIEKWVNTKCPKCKGKAKRETNTMPQWAGSCWYCLRYLDPKNKKELVDKEKEKYWMSSSAKATEDKATKNSDGVDLYVGGAEHAVLHLMYARFWHMFLFDIGVVSTEEPFYKLRNQGIILGEDSRKMSKSRGNVINPDDVIKEFGADSMRLYEMFMGPFEDVKPWSTQGICGVYRFLNKVWLLQDKVKEGPAIEEFERLKHKLIKKVTEDIETFNFNTAVSSFMEAINTINKEEVVPKNLFETFLILLSPFAPHIAEELWEQLGHKKSITEEKWPEYDERKIQEEVVQFIVQVNGKLRDRVKAPVDSSEEEVKKLALDSEKVKKYIITEPQKVIFVKNRLINFVV